MTVASAVAFPIFWWASYPYWYIIEMFFFTFFIGGALLLFWGVRLAIAAGQGVVSGRLRRWLLPWLIPVVVVVALVADAPFWVRFTISAPSMEAYAKTVTDQSLSYDPCRWLGLYYVCGAFPYTDLEGKHPLGSSTLGVESWFGEGTRGFVWLPEGQPEETADDRYRHLKGHWYGWQGWDSW